MKIPASVKVGCYSYRVERPTRPLIEGSPVWGHYSNVHQRILVDESVSEDRAAVTLLHEALHAIDDLVHLDLTEEQVIRLAPALLAFLRDNDLLREDDPDDDAGPVAHIQFVS